MLFELRQYRVQPGKMDEWVRFMEEEIIPFQTSKGMTIVASFRGEEDPDAYVWIRRFTDEAERVRQYEAVYESEKWKNEISPRVGEILDRTATVVTRLNPTPISGIQ